MPNQGAGGNTDARLSVLESSVEAMAAQLNKIEGLLSGHGKPNWVVVAAFGALAITMWGAAINPLHNDIARQEKSGESLATAVLKQNEVIGGMQIQLTRNIEHIAEIEIAVEDMRHNGTANSDKRVSILEERIADMRMNLQDVREHGSPITDKRLSILEAHQGK